VTPQSRTSRGKAKKKRHEKFQSGVDLDRLSRCWPGDRRGRTKPRRWKNSVGPQGNILKKHPLKCVSRMHIENGICAGEKTKAGRGGKSMTHLAKRLELSPRGTAGRNSKEQINNNRYETGANAALPEIALNQGRKKLGARPAKLSG